MRSFLKFRLLVWKNFLIQKRKYIATPIEIGFPTLLSLALMFLRLRVESEPHSQVTLWDPCDYTTLDPKLQHLTLAYSPDNEVTSRIMRRVNQSLSIAIAPFPDENMMVNFITFVNGTKTNNSNIYLGGIVFDNAFHVENGTPKLKRNVYYKIRLSYAPRIAPEHKGSLNAYKSDTTWSTNFMFPVYQVVGPRKSDDDCNGDPGYKREGFLAVQHAVNDAIMYEFLPEEKIGQYNSTNILLRRHPYPPYMKDNFVLVLQQQMPLVIMLSLIAIVLFIVRDIVLEKERKLKETLKMMGINNWLHWIAWFTKHILFLLVSIAIMTLFYCIAIDSEKGAVIAQTNPFILFLYLLCYSIATITYCFAVSVFFAKANTGAAVGCILYFCVYIACFFLQRRYETLSLTAKLAACLDFQVAMAFGGVLLGQFEGIGSGIQLSNIAEGVSVDDDFNMLMVLIMLLVDSVLHCLVAWYVEAIFPGEYGVPQPWYFPFLRSYWGCCHKSVEFVNEDDGENVGQDPTMFEREPNKTVGIKIRNLRKVYGSGEKRKVAVAGMTLNMYEGQITALLGHNGAGKTTSMCMLTGFYPPTSGTAIINGYDIRREISEVRSSLGLCPQHDVLFDNLTVEEHMIFFGLLKGVPSNEVIPQSLEMLTDMELFPKLKAKAKTLSGGMKRKLSVCIALIGNSKIVFLDEPSSGLDPKARRNIWTVLQRNRAGRTMVLSTHFMDEADLLGDRIAIMADGVVKCCGSSIFLKKKYGAGYHVVVVKDAGCDVRHVTQIVKSHISQAEMESNVGAELSYILPQDCVGSFEALFIELEQRQKELGISSFGVSATTMEEVFLKAGESQGESQDTDCIQSLESQNEMISRANNHSSPMPGSSGSMSSTENHIPLEGFGTTAVQHDSSPVAVDFSDHSNLSRSDLASELSCRRQKNVGLTLFRQQFLAMLLKRILHTVRNLKVTVTQLIVPLFFTIMGIVIIKTLPNFKDMPALILEAEGFGKNIVPYASASSLEAAMARSYANQFLSSSVKTVDLNTVPGYEKDADLLSYLATKGKEGIGFYNLRYMVAASFNHTDPNAYATVTAFYNNQGYHSIAISLGTMFNGLLNYFTNSTNFSIRTANHPLPRLTANEIEDIKDGRDLTGFTLAFNITFGMAFLASSFVLFLVNEKAVKAKHIQFVSGVHPINFWLSTVIWDMINFLIPCVALVITFFSFDIENFTHDLHWLQLMLLFLVYGWSMLPNMYFFSFAFKVSSTAYVWITVFNILTGVATLLVVVILSIPQIGLQDVANALEWTFLAIFPNFCLAQGLFDVYENYKVLGLCKPVIDFNLCPIWKMTKEIKPCCRDYCGDFCLYYNIDFLGWEKNGIGRMLIFLTMQGFIMWGLIFASEYGLLQRLRYMLSREKEPVFLPPGVYTSQMSTDRIVQEDEDVAKERSKINSTVRSVLLRENKVLLHNLTKYYGDFRAVDHLSVGIPAGECFGLLGINGAGKTSTFMMLTGDSFISSGEVFIDSYSLKTQKDLARKKIGYCPQFDALIAQLTGREILTLFARLRGILEADIVDAVNSLMAALTLTPHADKQCQRYSGGNKRKLSTAIALIGDPDVVFLDEPTTGMDPVARKMLCEVLCVVRDSGRTLVLTSHSMEEIEAICTRLAIMVNGQFKCLGSIQHLKNKFGEGYTFMAKVTYPEDGSEPDLTALRDFVESTFPNSKLTDIHENAITYHIMDTSLTWAQVFGEMEKARDRLHIEDYLVSQTSLESVFISFARMQDSHDQ